ncbi:unnamed protein product [Alopecurus aequalis]
MDFNFSCAMSRRPHLCRDGVAIKPVRAFFSPFKQTDAAASPTKSASESESMAATSSAALFSVVPHPLSAATTTASARTSSRHYRPTRSVAAVSRIRCSAASPDLSPGAPAPAPPKPQIELEFLGPKPGADGSYPVDRASAVSGDKLLRDIMTENKLELYGTYTCHFGLMVLGACAAGEADELRRRGQLRHLHRRDNRWEGAPEREDGHREALPEEETGVMEADLPDDRREQGELRQGCRPTAAPVEEVTIVQSAHYLY